MAMTLVSTVTVGSGGAASIEFTNIPQTGKDLLLLVSGRIDASIGQTSYVLKVNFNNDTGSNQYTRRRLRGSGSAASSATLTSTYLQVEALTTDDATASTFGNIGIYTSNYTSSAVKSVSVDAVSENNATAAAQEIVAGVWQGTSAISSIQLSLLSDTFEQHSSASLYIIS